MTDGKPNAVLLQSISGVSAINPLVAFYDIHKGKREVLFFYFVQDTTPNELFIISVKEIKVRKKNKRKYWMLIVQKNYNP
jgi:hypothetical protein